MFPISLRMAAIPESVRAVLTSSALAHLVTLDPDGSPQVSIVWVGLDGDDIVAGHLADRRKVRNIRNDDRVALSFETGTHNDRGLVEYLVVPLGKSDNGVVVGGGIVTIHRPSSGSWSLVPG
jgi:predicted pyridoxine 5'-phosphate oxidase superfamily flavin-nucleotide-binding protein